jgi:hypothetical protein
MIVVLLFILICSFLSSLTDARPGASPTDEEGYATWEADLTNNQKTLQPTSTRWTLPGYLSLASKAANSVFTSLLTRILAM